MMTCTRCGGPMSLQQGMWWCGACQAYGVMAPGAPAPRPIDPAHEATTRSLLRWSRLLGWGGLAVMLLGPIGGGMLAGVGGALAAGGLGFVSMVVGAVIGTVARARQGRVI